MKLELIPYESIGDINFGAKQEEVRAILGNGFESYKKTSFSKFKCDDFEKLGIVVYYRKGFLVEAIEFAEPAEVILGGDGLFKLEYKELLDTFRNRDANLEIEDGVGFTSYEFGIGFYNPDGKRHTEGILVFEKGYYDD